MEDREKFQTMMLRQVRPIYDTYMYGLNNGWKMDDIIIAIIIESLTSTITPDNLDNISVMPQIHGTLNDMLKTNFDLRKLVECTIKMKKESSYFIKRLDELSDEIMLNEDD